MATDTRYPGTVANAGSGDSWTNTGNVTADDGSEASVGISGSSTKQLVCTNFGFTVPTDATITAITVTYERRDAVLQAGISSANVYKVASGTADTGTDYGDSATWAALETKTASISVSGVTPADVNDSGFGAAIKANAPGGLGLASIDYVTITVTWADPPTWLMALMDCGCCDKCETLYELTMSGATSDMSTLDLEETATDWEVITSGGTRLQTDDTGAQVLTVNDTFPAKFVTALAFQPNDGATAATMEFKYIFGWEDSNNYWYVRIQTAPSLGATVALTFEFHRVHSSTDDQVGATVGTIVAYPIPSVDGVGLFLCASGGHLHWYMGTVALLGSADPVYSYPLPTSLPDESRHGIELVSISGSSPSLQVNAWKIGRHIFEADATAADLDDTHCNCPLYCQGCANGLFPDEWEIEIAGLTNSGNRDYSGCNGTYVLDGKKCETTLSFTRCSPPPNIFNPAAVDRMTLEITGSSDPAAYAVVITMWDSSSGIGTPYVTFETSGDSQLDCMDLELEIPITQQLTTVMDTGATATLRNVP